MAPDNICSAARSGSAQASEQPPEALRFLDRVEILPLQVLHQGGCTRLGVRHGSNEAWHFGEAGQLGGAPAALTCDDLVAPLKLGVGADQDGLQQSLGLD